MLSGDTGWIGKQGKGFLTLCVDVSILAIVHHFWLACGLFVVDYGKGTELLWDTKCFYRQYTRSVDWSL